MKCKHIRDSAALCEDGFLYCWMGFGFCRRETEHNTAKLQELLEQRFDLLLETHNLREREPATFKEKARELAEAGGFMLVMFISNIHDMIDEGKVKPVIIGDEVDEERCELYYEE